MEAGKYEYQSEFARKYFAQGRDKGREEGEAQGEARGLLKVLKARGFDVPDSLRAHILACADTDLIDQWYERAVRAERLEDIFEASLLA
jgi:hypothetical protein